MGDAGNSGKICGVRAVKTGQTSLSRDTSSHALVCMSPNAVLSEESGQIGWQLQLSGACPKNPIVAASRVSRFCDEKMKEVDNAAGRQFQ
jgi:hypothetical protein